MSDMTVFEIILYYIITVNVLGFLFMGLDKWKAKKRAFRIPEATLFIIAIIGGALGSILGMYLFRHKTKHWYFVYGMPAILVIHILLLLFIWKGPIQFTIL